MSPALCPPPDEELLQVSFGRGGRQLGERRARIRPQLVATFLPSVGELGAERSQSSPVAQGSGIRSDVVDEVELDP